MVQSKLLFPILSALAELLNGENEQNCYETRISSGSREASASVSVGIFR
jgi:hypothetical protein